MIFRDRIDAAQRLARALAAYQGKNPLVLAIPPGVAHGYRVLGSEPAALFYHTTEHYDPAQPDEERIAFDDPRVGFDWRTRHR